MSMFKKLSLAMIAGTFVIGLSGCPEQEGPAERAGEEVDEAVEEGDEALEDTGDAMEDAGDEVDDGR